MIKELPKLNYAFDALEPYIDTQTMEVHYTKHHKTYLDKLTMAITGTPLENMELEDILMSPEAIDENIRTAVINNGGGVFNHNFFWSVIGPAKSTGPDGMLLEKINGTFGSFDMFKEEFTKSALGLFGSGWTWLVQDKEGNVKIMNTQNQASPISEGYKPLLALDVWEHAYYLKYQNRRADYITNWWNIVDWANITL
ncbi:MAG: Superoxide dismutase [candidate division WWE3 bacterium GW2011_GWF2_41_45]|uniref:Superoxide dismutase n=3 Tax=Katanobacteria TaxID=422282 RepID=A0A1F4VZZ7_UNCKA|nr:MAG: Superoxide dismutase [candidate division WWE3 bacterium GW2011_GWC2_41_23]KKS10274.1 MAG: Superoxide dismutase [candidate division WWE3 bacterium GW2011_GWF2_41_45]KKS12241.1 MAG: Superoxide dismutase [candidate division WWE3 bacterium GW2011_GWF1_41_53]KKS20016.1 MAG: Superoxide dismutase [candidate division WWE3 bacterium GW2011_GWE1_41_72]KKS29329.1 MAG: Superoxide dismutase [candidate division WWE3 bacterium GW2011_GWD2_42_11]KKS50911.1 MAG: Superoxide dismutase [candidate division